MPVCIIGGGLAGSEAAWQAAEMGVAVELHEMRPTRPTAGHKTDRLAELVCSNSFRGDKLDNAVGLLKEEMRRLGSLVMRTADRVRVPAGAALAVDRDKFSEAITAAIAAHPRITVVRGEVPRPCSACFQPVVAETTADCSVPTNGRGSCSQKFAMSSTCERHEMHEVFQLPVPWRPAPSRCAVTADVPG